MTALCTCPTCGQPVASAITVAGLTDLFLGKNELAIIETLGRHYPKGIRTDRLIDAVWAGDINGGPDNPRVALGVTINRLQKKLPPYGWTIAGPGMGRREGCYSLRKLEA